MTRNSLHATIEFVSEQLATIPALDSSSMDAYAKARNARSAAEASVKNTLTTFYSARFTDGSGATAVSIDGIRSTSTSGMEGALRNWVSAARRRLEKAGA